VPQVQVIVTGLCNRANLQHLNQPRNGHSKASTHMSDVLVVHAEERQTQGFVGAMAPLGVAWLAGSLETAGVSVEVLDRQVDPRSFAEVFRAGRPAILGISTTTAARFQAFRYAAQAKRLAPETLVVLGGSHATCTARDTLTHVPHIDAVVAGEGEATFLAVAERFLTGERDLGGIPGLWHRHDGEILAGPARPRERNLDNLGFPARHLLPNSLYKLENEFVGGSAFHIMASRGCPYACTFCSAARIWGHRVTFRTPRHVVDEMEHLRDSFGAGGFRFMDALVTLRRSFVLELCREILDRGLKLPWECEVRVDTIDEEILLHMRDAGCYYLDFGAESVSPRVLARMKKKITPEQISAALVLAHRLGFKTKVFFTFGHIEESLEDARTTLSFIRQNARYISRLGGGIGINIFPGTEVEEFARACGALPADFSWATPFHEGRNRFFATPPSVPILIQPGFGWREMFWVRCQQLLQKAHDPQVLRARLRRLGGRIAPRRLGRRLVGASQGDGTRASLPR
jgi:radical SAM superfamily enzyme YgiQ (UPF0313 family)